MSTRNLNLGSAALGLAGLVLLSPVFAIVALAILLDDGGPVFFVQDRLGRGRAAFRIYKFRSMRGGRITRAGAWLRTTGLDELPQLVNLLRGDMTLVGPRPLTAEDVRRLGWEGAERDLRWSLRPGVAGLAQLYAGRGARLSWFLDRRYVESHGLRMNALILLATAAMSLVGKRPVRRLLRRRGWRALFPAAGVPRLAEAASRAVTASSGASGARGAAPAAGSAAPVARRAAHALRAARDAVPSPLLRLRALRFPH